MKAVRDPGSVKEAVVEKLKGQQWERVVFLCISADLDEGFQRDAGRAMRRS